MSLIKKYLVIKTTNTQPAFTCPKSTTETPEQAPTTPKVDNKDTSTTPMALPRCLYCQPRTHPTHCPSASIAPLPAGYLQSKLIL